MTATRVAWLVVGSGFIAAWLTAATTTRQVETIEPTVAAAPQQLAPSPMALDLAAEVARLRGRLGAAPLPRIDGRNPFELGTALAPPVTRTIGPPRAADPAPPIDLTPAPLAVRLIGIAEDDTGTEQDVVRTAILSLDGQVVLAVEGETVGGGYVVERVGMTVVDLRESASGKPQQLFLP